jgi:hypothetical protein
MNLKEVDFGSNSRVERTFSLIIPFLDNLTILNLERPPEAINFKRWILRDFKCSIRSLLGLQGPISQGGSYD